MDACQQRQAMYDAWPDDPHYLQQQLSLIRQELMEKEEQLQRAHTDVRLLTSECMLDERFFWGRKGFGFAGLRVCGLKVRSGVAASLSVSFMGYLLVEIEKAFALCST